MKLLVSRAVPGLIKDTGEADYRDNLGLLVSPRLYANPQHAIDVGATWACDNDCFNGLNKALFVQMLKSLKGLPGCKFVAAPDVVADAVSTLLRFQMWQPVIKHFGFPVALVAQDGLESLPIWWDRFDALFIGGSTEWKLGEFAAALVQEAKRRGKWTHMGRVNSNRRIHYATAIGCDSIDGTGYAKFSKQRIPKALPALKTYTLPLWEGMKCA